MNTHIRFLSLLFHRGSLGRTITTRVQHGSGCTPGTPIFCSAAAGARAAALACGIVLRKNTKSRCQTSLVLPTVSSRELH